MKQLHYSDNPNGKLFNDRFNDLRVDNIEALELGEEYAIFLNNKYLGSAILIAKREIKMLHIGDILSYMHDGSPVSILSKKLKLHNPDIAMDTPLAHIVLEWDKRYIENQSLAIHNWWTKTFNNAVQTTQELITI